MSEQSGRFRQLVASSEIARANEEKSKKNLLAKIDMLQGRAPEDCMAEVREIAADIVNAVHTTEKGKADSMQRRFDPEHEPLDLVRAVLNFTKKDFEDAPEYCVAVAQTLLEKPKER